MISRGDESPGKYQIADGFVLNTMTGDVWKYDESSDKFKVVEKEDSLLTSVERAKTYLDRSEEIDGRVREWEERLSELGDDSQLANIDLQNMLQKQQQTMQMLSNISKVLHDTAMAVVRKIG
jgi:DNA integrity scanning protein DisA with diadenylate cyclase activity